MAGTPRSQSWTVDCRFDGSDFDFDVVLGGSYGDRTGRTFVHGPDQTKTCHVWVHKVPESERAERGGRALSRLEVFSPLTDDEERVEYDLAAECQEQLAFVLALFKPVRSVDVSTSELRRFAGQLIPFRFDRRHFMH